MSIRRVKCDEAKPACHNCCSTGRQCLGYSHDNSQLLQASQGELLRQISASLGGTQRERRAFEFYCVRTSPRLTGSDDHAFWGQLVIQRAYVDTGIRHAIIALASFYEDFESGAENCVFALEQYNLAIRKHFDSFKSENGPATVEVYVSCLVFVCIEMLRANFTSAISLAQKSLSLLHGSTEGQSPGTSNSLLHFLQRQFYRIQVQAIGLIGHVEGGSKYPPQAAQIVEPTIPSIFSSVSEAQDYLEFYGQLYSLSTNDEQTGPIMGGPADFDIRIGSSEPYIDILRQWTNAFDAFLIRRANSLTDQERHAVRILRMRQLLSHISLEVSTHCLPSDEQEMVWDNHCSEFNDAVVLAESILTTMGDWEDASSLIRRKPSFSLDFVSVGPLYDIARRCRDPTIRRKAIDTLRTFRRREGMWDSEMALLVAERIVAIEEDGVDVASCEDVPSWRRIFNVHPVLALEDKKIYLHYERIASPTQAVRVQVQEVIPYREI
ncbi:hypothetical protein UA08_08787 [Talaromyces atroroseus]|uniref:Zn(2)-C6 fungal-type domain-containing protein n=1 Tax=Talaromyces atroroseus TaxID=1441469 RepID=A0A225ADR2_TALAT|nr:hypothetical protein UA08_08787 [Talaromyces atroroseus]OKL56094.1 hypothetical protein UA08_08787 [Talaromyces atroroseus]